MRRFLSAFPFVAVLLALNLVPARAADPPKDIKAAYNKMIGAMKSKSTMALRAISTPDFKMTGQMGEMNLDQAIATMENQFKTIDGVPSASIKYESCKVSGKTATLVTTTTMKFTMKMPPDNKPAKFDVTARSKDVLVKTRDGWKFKRSDALDEKVKMNGKPFDPSKAGGGAG